MDTLEKSLKAVEQAVRRKKELRELIELLFQEYKLVKTEIKKHQAHIEKLMSEREYSAYLDTIGIDASLEFPFMADEDLKTK